MERLSDPPILLPSPSTPFIGRERELVEIAGLLADPACRLLTLVGLGGIGKTRLAVEAASRQAGDFRDGVVFVDLQPLDDAEGVAPAIAAVLQLSLSRHLEPVPQLCHFLRDKHLLLLLDNLEHLLTPSPWEGARPKAAAPSR